MIQLVNPMPALGDGRAPVITSGMGSRAGGYHAGADMLYPKLPDESGAAPNSDGTWIVPDGVPALAAAAGTVTQSSPIATGERVSIDHGDGVATAYMHLASRSVGVGDTVTAGQPIGIIGAGNTGLTHLHFELHQNGIPTDPAPYLSGARVLPMPGLGLGAVLLAIGVGYVLYRYVF